MTYLLTIHNFGTEERPYREHDIYSSCEDAPLVVRRLESPPLSGGATVEGLVS